MSLRTRHVKGTSLATTRAAWTTQAKKYDVLSTSIHDLLDVASASKIGDDQYYALRIIWKIRDKFPERKVFGIPSKNYEARKFLKQNDSWQAYLEDLKYKKKADLMSTVRDYSPFSMVRFRQKNVRNRQPSTEEELADETDSKFSPRLTRHRDAIAKRQLTEPPSTPTPICGDEDENDMSFLSNFENVDLNESFIDTNPQSPASPTEIPPADDEEIMTQALLEFLDALTIFHPTVQRVGFKNPRWTAKRLQLIFGRWEARTDGYLWTMNRISALLEVKPFVRNITSRSAIQKQEAAQIACFIRNGPDKGGWSAEVNGRTVETLKPSAVGSY